MLVVPSPYKWRGLAKVIRWLLEHSIENDALLKVNFVRLDGEAHWPGS